MVTELVGLLSDEELAALLREAARRIEAGQDAQPMRRPAAGERCKCCGTYPFRWPKEGGET